MRRAALVALATLVAAIAFGLLRASGDIDDETDAAQSLARVMALMATLGGRSDADALAALRGALTAQPLRHLRLSIHTAGGRELLGPPRDPPEPALLAPLLALHRVVAGEPPPEPVRWDVDRGAGERWVVTLAPSRSSERSEALSDLLGLVVVLLAGTAAMLGVMAHQVHRAFRPLQALLGAIDGVQHGDTAAVRQLPPMPTRELQSLASALQALGGALAAAEDERRLLARQVLSLQEDERQRLARELHDEFGQHLTAMRVDLAWLQKRLQGNDEVLQVLQGTMTHCERIQADVRQVLTRLQPLGPLRDTAAPGDAAEPFARLVDLLEALVGGWRRTAGPRCLLEIDAPPGGAPALPRSAVLSLYRISQEALTNVARHAQAREAVLRLRIAVDEGRTVIDWSVRDDGIGLADPAAALQRGSGLAGIKERIWALGGDLRWHGPPGLALSARIVLPEGRA